MAGSVFEDGPAETAGLDSEGAACCATDAVAMSRTDAHATDNAPTPGKFRSFNGTPRDFASGAPP
jgi:hypothetical protein